MSAAEVVQRELWNQCCEGDPDAILDALKATGYAVVELPKPTDTSESGRQFFDASPCTAIAEAGTDAGFVTVHGLFAAAHLDPVHTRRAAAALLAAADAAEAS